MSSDLEIDVAAPAADQPPAAEDPPRSGEVDLVAEVRRLRELFESKIHYDDVRARQVEAMHEELEQHRRGLAHEFLRPVLTDLVRLHDDLVAHAERVDEEGRPEEVARIAGYVRGSIEETLARNGVESYTVDEPVVDRRLQKVIGVVATDDPALHRTVASRVRRGFRFDDKILRPEWVHAYQLDPSATAPADVPPAVADDVKENQ